MRRTTIDYFKPFYNTKFSPDGIQNSKYYGELSMFTD